MVNKSKSIINYQPIHIYQIFERLSDIHTCLSENSTTPFEKYFPKELISSYIFNANRIHSITTPEQLVIETEFRNYTNPILRLYGYENGKRVWLSGYRQLEVQGKPSEMNDSELSEYLQDYIFHLKDKVDDLYDFLDVSGKRKRKNIISNILKAKEARNSGTT